MRTSGKYILQGHDPIEVYDLEEWGQWCETADRGVAETHLPGGVRISTVFLGINYNFSPAGRPILFETMVFGGPHDGDEERYRTWDEAVLGHEQMVRRIREAAS